MICLRACAMKVLVACEFSGTVRDFGQCSRSNWIDARCHCLVFAKREPWTWNPDDTVLDPFAGSGTTAVVAKALGRNCTTIDVSAESLAQVKERIGKGAVRCG